MKSKNPVRQDALNFQNPTSVEPIGKLSNDEAKDLIEAWVKCPPNLMSNMFHTFFQKEHNYYHQRAVTYKLSPFALEELIGNYQNAKRAGKTCELKVHMGCNPDHDHQEIMKGGPGFSPFIQLRIHGDENPHLPYEHSYRCHWRQNATIPLSRVDYRAVSNAIRPVNASDNQVPDENNPNRVSPITAHDFLVDWANTPSNDLEKLFMGVSYGQVARVRSFTAAQENLELISKLWAKEPSRNLFVHLGAKTSKMHSPFGFHAVLEVATHSAQDVNALDDRGSTWIENLFLCPPLCF